VRTRLSLKNRFFLLIFLVSFAFMGVLVPYLGSIYQIYKFYNREYKGLLESEKCFSLLTALLSQNPEKISKSVEVLNDLLTRNENPPEIWQYWEMTKECIQNFLNKKVHRKEELLYCASELFKMEEAISQYSGAIADPDKAVENLLIAHYSDFPPLISFYIKNAFLSPLILSNYLKHLKYALKFKPELKHVLSNINKLHSYEVTLSDLLSIDKKVLNWAKTYTLHRKRKTLVKLYLSLFIVCITLASVLGTVHSLITTLNKSLTHLKSIARAIKHGDYKAIEKISLSAEECHEECFKSMQKLIEALKFQGENLRTLQIAIKNISEGKIVPLIYPETSGLLSELYAAETEVALQLNTLKSQLFELVYHLKRKHFKTLKLKGLKGEWKLWAYLYNNEIKNLQNFFNSFNQKCNLLKEGKIKEILISCPEECGAWSDYILSFKKSVNPFFLLYEDLKNLSIQIKKGKFQIEETVVQKKHFKNDLNQIYNLVIDIIQIYSKKLESLKNKLKEEEELNIFKNTIDDDISLEASYQRIKKLLQNKFKIKLFTWMKFDNARKKFILSNLSSVKQPLCNPKVLDYPEYCRAKRLKTIVIGNEEKWGKVCAMYNGPGTMYICIPFLLEGEVKCVLHISCLTQENFEKVQNEMPNILKYLERIIPILHTKEILKKCGYLENL